MANQGQDMSAELLQAYNEFIHYPVPGGFEVYLLAKHNHMKGLCLEAGQAVAQQCFDLHDRIYRGVALEDAVADSVSIVFARVNGHCRVEEDAFRAALNPQGHPARGAVLGAVTEARQLLSTATQLCQEVVLQAQEADAALHHSNVIFADMGLVQFHQLNAPISRNEVRIMTDAGLTLHRCLREMLYHLQTMQVKHSVIIEKIAQAIGCYNDLRSISSTECPYQQK